MHQEGQGQPMVLDFVNDPEEVRADFVKYYVPIVSMRKTAPTRCAVRFDG